MLAVNLPVIRHLYKPGKMKEKNDLPFSFILPGLYKWQITGRFTASKSGKGYLLVFQNFQLEGGWIGG